MRRCRLKQSVNQSKSLFKNTALAAQVRDGWSKLQWWVEWMNEFADDYTAVAAMLLTLPKGPRLHGLSHFCLFLSKLTSSCKRYRYVRRERGVGWVIRLSWNSNSILFVLDKCGHRRAKLSQNYLCMRQHRMQVVAVCAVATDCIVLVPRFFSVRTITHEPLHSARWNFAQTCTSTTARNVLI